MNLRQEMTKGFLMLGMMKYMRMEMMKSVKMNISTSLWKPMVNDIASAQGREGDILNELMSRENVLHQDTISIAPAPTPNRQTSRLDVDVAIDHCEPLAIDDTCKTCSFVDGLDIEMGQEVTNKMEVKNMTISNSLKSCFDFNIVRSATKLFVVKSKVEDCKWALRARSISGSDRFSVRTYTNIHTCSSSFVDKGNPKATSQLVANMWQNNTHARWTYLCQIK